MMAGGTPDVTFGESSGTPDLYGDDAEILTESEHGSLVHVATNVSVNPSGLSVITTDDVQAALGELDSAVATIDGGSL